MKKLFLYYFYGAVKHLALFCFRIYYREIIILHPELTKIKGPTLLASNHPSTLTDPLHTAANLSIHPHFLINAGMVQHWFAHWFFNTFYCIPIARSKDTGDRKVDNAQSFAKAIEYLAEGGSIYIAPEGISNLERRLQDLKTGLARIALSTESEKDFKLGLRIQPFGLNYTDQRSFRSSVVINVGEPFTIEGYEETYEKAPRETVRELTEDLAVRMRKLMIDTVDPEEDQLLKTLGRIFQAKESLSLQKQFYRSQDKLEQIKTLRAAGAEGYEVWRQKAANLDEALNQKQTDQAALFVAANGSLQKKMNSRRFRLLFGIPLFIYGWINNFIPNFIPGFLAKKMKLYPGYDPAIKMLSGLIFYPIIYGLQVYLVQWYFGQWWITLLYLLTLYPLGIFAWNYRQYWFNWKKERAMRQWQKQQPEEVEKRSAVQKELLEKFN